MATDGPRRSQRPRKKSSAQPKTSETARPNPADSHQPCLWSVSKLVNSKVNAIGAARLRKVKYRVISVLTSKLVQASIASILDSLRRSDLEDAKRKLQALAPEIKSDKERGSLLAASGIYASISKAKEGRMQTWDNARVERAAKSIVSSQMADEFDIGYAETLMNYSKLTQDNLQSAE